MSGVVSYELLNSKLPTNSGWTADGGIFETFINDTGATSVKGTIVVTSSSVNYAVSIAPADSQMPMGIIAESGIANGANVKVTVYGKAYVLLKNGESATRGYWCEVSDTAGRMAQQATVPSTIEHNREIGHSLETVSSGTNVLSLIQVHFN